MAKPLILKSLEGIFCTINSDRVPVDHADMVLSRTYDSHSGVKLHRQRSAAQTLNRTFDFVRLQDLKG
ncbi:hypothetical protein SP21_58 [Salmonella phage 21]|nr:hypothetical protein SP21_58 [Salmonella phage 21]